MMKINVANTFFKALTLIVLLTIQVSSIRAVATAESNLQKMADTSYDLHFIDMMIVHHQEVVEMIQMVDTRSKNARLKTFAQKLGAAQPTDMDELQRYRNQWYANEPLMDRAMMESMPNLHRGMNMDIEDTRRKLLAAEGTTFDNLLLETLTHHHLMAIEMAKEAATKAEHAELREYARKAAVKQQNEIDEMNRLKGIGTSKKKGNRPRPKPAHKH